MQMHENTNGSECPSPEECKDDYGPNPNCSSNQDRATYENPSKEIAALKEQLQESQKQVENLERELLGAVTKGSNSQLALECLHSTHMSYTRATKAEINTLRNKLKESENKVRQLQKNSREEAAQRQFQWAQLQRQLKNNKKKSDKTIKGLQKELQMVQMFSKRNQENSKKTIYDLIMQLEQARSKLPFDETSVSLISLKLEGMIENLQEQRSRHAAGVCAEPSSEATEGSHTELKSAKDADLEVKCSKQQEQIQQLQEAQRRLEEQATQHRQEREQFQSEMDELKYKLATYKDLNASYLKITKEEKEEKRNMAALLEKAEAEKELLQLTVGCLQESAQEKQGTEQDKEEKDSPLEAVKSLQESLKRKEDKENIFIDKLDELKAQPATVPEKPEKKKKKRNWFLRLFTRNAS